MAVTATLKVMLLVQQLLVVVMLFFSKNTKRCTYCST
jgi:hypothetical protein